MRQIPEYGPEETGNEDHLAGVAGPYQEMRRRLYTIGFGVLPHPAMGFGNPSDEGRALEAISKLSRGRVSAHLY